MLQLFKYIACVLFVTSSALAQEDTSYYTIKNAEPAQTENTSINPVDTIVQLIGTTVSSFQSLLDWDLHNEALPTPSEPYHRLTQFGHWINDPTDDSCMNTRAKVLARDSEGNLTYTTPRNCVVQQGLWKDPYTQTDLTISKQVQIDHVVPLKHAYLVGAWRWDYNTRCLYANFLGDSYHLLSVSGHENMSKGDSAPDQYMPPATNFRCEYLKIWLKIKTAWKLAIEKSEGDAINQLMQENNCNPNDFTISNAELNAIHSYIQNNLNYCVINHR